MNEELAVLDRTISTLAARLLAKRTPSGHWEGHLSSSALSTATAVIALMLDERASSRVHASLVEGGLGWIAANQNGDGGWGDTSISASNLSTTVLCWSTLSLTHQSPPYVQLAVGRAERWLRAQIGDVHPATLTRAILSAYGKDRTFSAPILTVLALAGKLGVGPDEGWRFVPQLPFELAACPHRWLEWLRLPVVSYALPALVAIGQARHHHKPSRNPLLAVVRSALRSKTLTIARSMQPDSGGYLEATPLTSFVVMSLIGSARATHPIVEHGIRFLCASARTDGSWPIDTNLATWVTTLSVRALESGDFLADEDEARILKWLLRQQVQEEHPFTYAKPGGWAWTDLAGGVPDADDTAGALLALPPLAGMDQLSAAVRGVEWLLTLQNGDGGIPTFCRGWGTLPFDRSAPDLTAHALEAWDAWYPALQKQKQREIAAASRRAVSYLANCQQSDGSWIPLWFGNEQMPGHVNRTYGTSRVVTALTVPLVRDRGEVATSRQRGVVWLLGAQNADGGWGGGATPSTIEETGIALRALARNALSPAIGSGNLTDRTSTAISHGMRWLIAATDEGRQTPATPIGLYFARLWYYEELYPLIFALGGLSELRTALLSAARQTAAPRPINQ